MMVAMATSKQIFHYYLANNFLVCKIYNLLTANNGCLCRSSFCLRPVNIRRKQLCIMQLSLGELSLDIVHIILKFIGYGNQTSCEVLVSGAYNIGATCWEALAICGMAV